MKIGLVLFAAILLMIAIAIGLFLYNAEVQYTHPSSSTLMPIPETEAVVIRAILKHLTQHDQPLTAPPLVMGSTSITDFYCYSRSESTIASNLSPEDRQMLSRWQMLLQSNALITNKALNCQECFIMPPEELEEIVSSFPAYVHDEIRRRYPFSGHDLRFSRVGFNSSHDRAILMVASFTETNVFVLERLGNDWSVQSTIRLCIA